MNADRNLRAVAEVLHDVGEIHHLVFKKYDGADPDWASWYADWLIRLSPLPELLGTEPIRSELVYLLVGLDRAFNRERPNESWEQYYARELVQCLAPSHPEERAPVS